MSEQQPLPITDPNTVNLLEQQLRQQVQQQVQQAQLAEAARVLAENKPQ